MPTTGRGPSAGHAGFLFVLDKAPPFESGSLVEPEGLLKQAAGEDTTFEENQKFQSGARVVDLRKGVAMSGFPEKLRMLRHKTRKSKYKVSQYSGIDQSYILRLETGEKANPSRDVVLMLSLGLVHDSDVVGIDDVDELLLAAGYAPFRRRGKPI